MTERDVRPTPEPPAVPEPDSSETYPMEKPPRPDLSTDELAATISELIHGREAEEVSEIFQMAFEKLPGVELSSPGDEDYPGEETLYTPGAEGRPSAGFRLEELMSLIQEVVTESEWYDITAGEEGPPHSTGDVEQRGLVQNIQRLYHELQETFTGLDETADQEN